MKAPQANIEEDVFDPTIHLAYAPPAKVYTLEDLKLPPAATGTQIAATSPFPILSPEGVRAYRRSLFTPAVFSNCTASPNPGALTIRNGAAYSTFVRDFWTHPETMRIMSEVAGIPLTIVMPTEIGHTNVQTDGNTIEEMVSELKVEPDNVKIPLTEEDRAYDPLKASSIIPWHYDSYPFVCVIMLSDTEGMLGGETYIKDGDGIPMKVEGPSLGHGAFLQGGQVEHLAARCMGTKERISTITSFRADVSGIYDSSYITNIRCYCDREVLYKEWAEFRLAKMKEEIELLQDQLAQSTMIDVSKVHRFAEDQMRYLKRTATQLISADEFKIIDSKFSVSHIRNARRLWAKAEMLDDFNERVATVTPENWMPTSRYWVDLAETQMAVKAGRTLESQKGRFKWTQKRPVFMGDELLRQGVPEYFLLWLDATGLYDRISL